MAEDNGTVRIWDADSGREVRVLAGKEGEMRGLAYSPDGSRLAVGGQDNRLQLWNVAEGRLLLSIDLDHHDVTALAFHPDGERLAAANRNGKVKVWPLAALLEGRK